MHDYQRDRWCNIEKLVRHQQWNMHSVSCHLRGLREGHARRLCALVQVKSLRSIPCAYYHPIISCHLLYHVVLSYHIISFRIMSYHIVSYHIVSYHLISYQMRSSIVSCRTIMPCLISYRLMSSIISCHAIMSCLISYRLTCVGSESRIVICMQRTLWSKFHGQVHSC